MGDTYLEQVGLQIETAVGTRYCRIPGKEVGVFAVMWWQGVPHRNCRMPHNSHVLSLPILEQRAQHAAAVAKTLWQDYGGVLLWRLDVTDSTAQQLRQNFETDVGQLGMQLGPWAAGGMRTGGGLPWGKFAVQAAGLPELWQAYQTTSTIAGHYLDVPRIPALGAVLGTKRTDCFTGLKLHTDNNKVEGAPEIACLNCAVLVWPPAHGFLRSAVIVNFVPATESQLHQHLVAALSRSSQCEDGCVRKGPFEMPSPGFALGGKEKYRRPGEIPTIQEANRLSKAELLSKIKLCCQGYIVERVELSIAAAQQNTALKKAKKELEILLEDKYL